jgi:hypothetical protein
MKQRLKAIFKGPVVFYPLLFAAFPILFFYVYNIRETSASQMWLPLVISVAATLVLWAVLSLILRSLAKAGLATAIFLVFFFSYGRLYEALETWGVFVPKHAYLFPVMLFIWGYCVYFIGRAKRDFRVTTRLFNITAVVLIAINLFNIVSYEIRLARLNTETSAESPEYTTINATEPSALPDIYFIILDEYASLSTIKKQFGYDNSEFANRLIEEGFFIAQESRTRFPATEYSLAATLNMEYVTEGTPVDVLLQKIAHNYVAEFLRSKGYTFVYIASTLSIDADLQYNFYKKYSGSAALVNEFMRILWETTMLRPFYMYIAGTQYENYHRGGVLGSLECLEKLPEMQGPKFVFAHIECPHVPFVFGSAGERVGAENFFNYVDKQVYLDQYIFITSEIEKVIDAILEKSKSPPIIILESDHGPKTLAKEDSTRIFNAIYLPDNGSEYLYDSISSVNVFRLIFNHYFSTNYTLLEDDWEP